MRPDIAIASSCKILPELVIVKPLQISDSDGSNRSVRKRYRFQTALYRESLNQTKVRSKGQAKLLLLNSVAAYAAIPGHESGQRNYQLLVESGEADAEEEKEGRYQGRVQLNINIHT